MSQLGTRISGWLGDEDDIHAVLSGLAGRDALRGMLARLQPKEEVLLLVGASRCRCPSAHAATTTRSGRSCSAEEEQGDGLKDLDSADKVTESASQTLRRVHAENRISSFDAVRPSHYTGRP